MNISCPFGWPIVEVDLYSRGMVGLVLDTEEPSGAVGQGRVGSKKTSWRVLWKQSQLGGSGRQGACAKALRQERVKPYWDHLTQEEGWSWGAARDKPVEPSGGLGVKGLTNMAASARETTGQPWRLSPLRVTRPTVAEASRPGQWCGPRTPFPPWTACLFCHAGVTASPPSSRDGENSAVQYMTVPQHLLSTYCMPRPVLGSGDTHANTNPCPLVGRVSQWTK